MDPWAMFMWTFLRSWPGSSCRVLPFGGSPMFLPSRKMAQSDESEECLGDGHI